MNEPEIVWHYCSGSAFGKIIESKCIHLSDSRFTNDGLELNYASKLIIGVVEAKCPGALPGEELRSPNESLPLIACFSAEDDMLSQWRSYADDGRGFALGFSVNSMSKLMGETRSSKSKMTSMSTRTDGREVHFIGRSFGPIKYRRDEQDRLIQKLCDTFLASDDEREIKARWLRAELIGLSPFLKHPGFREEKEWRVVDSQLSLDEGRTYEELEDSELRVDDTGIRRFTKLPIRSIEDDSHHGVCPMLVGVQLGPRANAELDDVLRFLEENEFYADRSIVMKSEIPYLGARR